MSRYAVVMTVDGAFADPARLRDGTAWPGTHIEMLGPTFGDEETARAFMDACVQVVHDHGARVLGDPTLVGGTQPYGLVNFHIVDVRSDFERAIQNFLIDPSDTEVLL